MDVTFSKLPGRRYTVRVVRENGPELAPRNGPGYHDYLPHDAVHFLVEAEARLAWAVFGQLAAGGNNIFWPADPKQRRPQARQEKKRKLRPDEHADMNRSETLASLCQPLWEVRAGHRSALPDWSSRVPPDLLDSPLVNRILARLDGFASAWHPLPLNGSVTLTWPLPVRRTSDSHGVSGSPGRSRSWGGTRGSSVAARSPERPARSSADAIEMPLSGQTVLVAWPERQRFGAVDVYYPDAGGACAGLLVTANERFADVVEQRSAWLPVIEAYQPGRFYLRELPAITAVLATTSSLDLLVIDGYVDLDPRGSPGLGAYVHAQTGLPVIGVAKTAFGTASHAVTIRRGATRPLFVTAAGLRVERAAALVAAMAGPHRLPDALRQVDTLARQASRRWTSHSGQTGTSWT